MAAVIGQLMDILTNVNRDGDRLYINLDGSKRRKW